MGRCQQPKPSDSVLAKNSFYELAKALRLFLADPSDATSNQVEHGLVKLSNRQGFCKDDLSNFLETYRSLIVESPLCICPLQYPGVYEKIEYSNLVKNKSPRSGGTYKMEECVLLSTTGQQYRNNPTWQAEVIEHAISVHPSARILSLACGSGPDWQMIQDSVAHLYPSSHFTLAVNDEGDLLLAEDKLFEVRSQYDFGSGNVLNFRVTMHCQSPIKQSPLI